ncbi:type II toxin-antitoxin system HigB family toxin [Leucothrix mucor]|uniref:type II toxin-antitoxin system HigB family toxin n=1 Tax=Leucothrix mucor TaxID=45248 RepID=UPI0003B4A961|nr:type II toxin-antitoxin system HigB family toxin [Leucothrix mucor]
MHVISKKPFSDAAEKYPNDRESIMDTYNVLRKGDFETPLALKEVFSSLDNFKYKDRWWIIDIGGNNLRLMAAILFSSQRIYVKYIVTHAEYDKLTNRYKKGEL